LLHLVNFLYHPYDLEEQYPFWIRSFPGQSGCSCVIRLDVVAGFGTGDVVNASGWKQEQGQVGSGGNPFTDQYPSVPALVGNDVFDEWLSKKSVIWYMPSAFIQSQVMAVVKPGCPACEETKPHLKQLKQLKRVRFKEVNVEEHPDVVDRLHVTGFPEVVYQDRHGQIYKMPWNGIPTSSNIRAWIEGIQKKQPQQQTGVTSNAMKRCTDCGSGGIDPSVWGPPLWFLIHMQALMYPSKPTQLDKEKTMAFFDGLVQVLPCASCAMHYRTEMAGLDRKKTFSSRDALFSWTVDFHNRVSERTKNPQPRQGVAFWKRQYKRQLMQAIEMASRIA